MKILIVTAWYHPFIHPRAHRWTAMAEHWAANGQEVQVLTARVREHGRSEILNGVQVHRVGFDSLKEWFFYWLGSHGARGRVGLKPGKPGLLQRMMIWVYKTVWKNLFFPDDACIWYFPAKRKLRQLLENESFDAIITVSLPFTGHLLGLVATNHQSPVNQSPTWLADIGDPFSFQAKPPNNAFFYRRKNRRLEIRILETADAVTVTTESTLHKYRQEFGEKAVAKMSVVPPLLTNIKSTSHQPTNHQITKLGYFGALYAPTRTPDAFLNLLAQTFAFRPDLSGRLETHFYGEIFPEFFEKLNAEPSIRLHGLCTREATWAAMQHMDILLNIGNTTDFQLPSKAVDYLATGKPILNLSYTEHDPFAAFFERNDLVFNLKIENETTSETELNRWLRWLESEKPQPSAAEIAQRVAPFLVGKIARQYLALITQTSSPKPI